MYVLIDVYGDMVICNKEYNDLEKAKEDLDAEFYLFRELNRSFTKKMEEICMINKEKILNELDNDVEKLARLLITCREITGWDETPTFEYITSDGASFDDDSYVNAFREALQHEIMWLNAKV